jgi:WXG100 family type VII secretion target
MSTGIKVDPATMSSLGKETVGESENLKSQIDSLKGNENNLMGIWKGDAAKTFDETVTSQMSNLELFKELIEELGTKINTGATTFDENEQQNVADAKKLLDDYKN